MIEVRINMLLSGKTLEQALYDVATGWAVAQGLEPDTFAVPPTGTDYMRWKIIGKRFKFEFLRQEPA